MKVVIRKVEGDKEVKKEHLAQSQEIVKEDFLEEVISSLRPAGWVTDGWGIARQKSRKK